MRQNDFIFNNEQNSLYPTLDDLMAEPKAHWGCKVDKMRDGDYSFGVCLTIDGFYGECYIFINLVKWTISIGKLMDFYKPKTID